MSIYLMGPHAPSHAMDHGQGRLWGQRHYSLFPLGQPEGLGGAGESSVERRD